MSSTVIDACCFINLYATGNVRDLLKDLGWSWYLPRKAMAESLYVRTMNDDGELEKTPIDAQSLVSEGLVREIDVEDAEEVRLFVRLASDLDDGEAMALAIAKHRAWMLATDDRKARRFAAQLGVRVVTTPELMRHWATAAKLGAAQTAEALRNIESGARFFPAENMPEHEWWIDTISATP